MPNTLAHIGVQGAVSYPFLKGVSNGWLYLGCIIPDLPWILQRVLKSFTPFIDPFSLRAYTIIQASLLFSLILCLAFSVCSKKPFRVFGLLSLNVLLHLMLDAMQLKWANGVTLIAPFSWKLTNWGLFWPENPVNYVLSGIGVIYLLLYLVKEVRKTTEYKSIFPERPLVGMNIVVIYMILPLAFISGPIEENNHFIQTLKNTEYRAGMYVEFDRAFLYTEDDRHYLRTWVGETFEVHGIQVSEEAIASLKGVFKDENKILAEDIHLHPVGLRDKFSYIGLALILISWTIPMMRRLPQSWK